MAIDIFIPKMGANIDEAEVGEIYFKKGMKVKKGDNLFEIITDKATFEVEAEESGTILELNIKTGDKLKVLEKVGIIGDPIRDSEDSDEEDNFSKTQTRVLSTPAARKIAKENNISLEKEFSGENKIIREEDVIKLVGLKNKEDNNKFSIEKLNPIKRAEIKNLSKSRESITSSVTITLSVKNLKNYVTNLNKERNLRLSVGQYIMYVCCRLLREFPRFNSYYDPETQEIKIYKDINLGIAMNTEKALIVPVIKNADKLDLSDFSKRFVELIMRSIKKEIKYDDLIGSTFTITDLSHHGVLNFIPIINSKQSSILGISSEYDSIKFIEGETVQDPKMNLTMVFDHRILDGKTVAEFLNKLRDNLEK